MNLELLKDALENDSNINIINETLGYIAALCMAKIIFHRKRLIYTTHQLASLLI